MVWDMDQSRFKRAYLFIGEQTRVGCVKGVYIYYEVCGEVAMERVSARAMMWQTLCRSMGGGCWVYVGGMNSRVSKEGG